MELGFGARVLFAVAAAIHVGAVLSRFDGFAGAIPAIGHAAILGAQLPLVMVEGLVLWRALLAAPKGAVELPLWMRIAGAPRWAFGLAFTYLGLFAVQTWELEFGGIGPAAPEVWPLPQRLAWFVGFSVVGCFPAQLAAAATLVPALRVITWPLRQVPPVIGAALAALVGGGVAIGALMLVDVKEGELYAEVAAMVAAVKANPAAALALTVAAPLASGAAEAVVEKAGERAKRRARSG